VAAVVWMAPHRGVAIQEASAFLAASVWFVIVGLKLYSQGSLTGSVKQYN